MRSSLISHCEFENIFKSNLKINTYSTSIESLFSQRSFNKINYCPDYQRRYVWDINKASYFIESILLGTEIPPIILFKEGTSIEVIDGRQRFESIKRFKENYFYLNKNGLTILHSLGKMNYDTMARRVIELNDLFLDAKLRIIEFSFVNEPPIDNNLIDRIKKKFSSDIILELLH